MHHIEDALHIYYNLFTTTGTVLLELGPSFQFAE